MPQLPKVIIANIGNLGVPQTYPHILEQAEVSVEPTQFFNSMYDKYPDGNIYLFLPKEFECAHEYTVEKMANKIKDSKHFAGVYSDMYMCMPNTPLDKRLTYLPAYDKSLLQTDSVINTPIMFGNTCRPIFHNQIKHLFFYQTLVTTGHRFVFCHIAEPLFNVRYVTQPSQQELQTDIQIIRSLK